MKLDYQRLGRYVLIANLIITGLVVYVAQGLVFGEPVLIDDTRLLSPIKPVRKAEPRGKSIYQDYSVITADRFLPRPNLEPGEPMPLVPIPGPSSALDRLVKLRGTAVSSEKGLSFAIVELLQNREFTTVRAGDEVAGATVLEIGEDSILVSMENEEIRLPLNATEEYGGKPKVESRSGRKNPRQAGRSGTARGNMEKIPPALQEQMKNLPPEMRRRWEQASPEEKRKYIQKFMERARGQGGGGGAQRPRRDTNRRR